MITTCHRCGVVTRHQAECADYMNTLIQKNLRLAQEIRFAEELLMELRRQNREYKKALKGE